MKLREAGRYLRMNPEVLRTKIYDGSLEAIKIPREKGIGGHEYYWITQENLDKFLAKKLER